ncbi:OLC1v1021141C1 [Oldenlandia corymbosa var. corymbosa]|uniref:OLC1v1021141C1 n=1 Tax=Oldenlandia corymbosa var. corymbosa TaxID=529605 RepID=A0AAV1BXG1_OLDCO|nr:OLC1v1021141C1 [Oldenlandia corymbosa var. corymbosa]
MQASQASQQSSEAVHMLYHQPFQPVEPFNLSPFQVLNSNIRVDSNSPGAELSFQTTKKDQFFTLESLPPTAYVTHDSPSAVSISSNISPFSPPSSYVSDVHHNSSDNTYGSPLSSSSGVVDGNELRHVLRELESKLMDESEIDDSCSCSVNNAVIQQQPFSARSYQLLQMAHTMDLKQLLLACAETVSNADMYTSERLMNVLEQRVSVSGEPLERLSAYMLEGLRARLLSSGSIIYKKLKCKEPTGPELMSYMSVLYQICPYYKFAYMSANVIIGEAMENESRIHIIDFQIAQGSQWVSFIQALAHRPGGPPYLRVTGVDDSQSTTARGGGLHLVGQRLAKVAESCGVPFEFHGAAISGCEVQLENLRVRHGEALAVNFPYMLHHMPDESVNTMNHRDRLLRLVKSLSPKVVTLIEQESNTNTAPFFPRFCETLDYYTAMFESIDAARPRDDKQRISAEEHCVARDIVNIVACEGADRVERHELFGKWRLRLMMAGFVPCPLSFSVGNAIRDMLKEYSMNYRLGEKDGALYLGWKNRPLATCSAWR